MYDKMTNSSLIALAYDKSHPKDNPSSENADLIDELIVRIQMLEGRIFRTDTGLKRNDVIEECAIAVETQKRGTRYQWESESHFGTITKEIANRVRGLKSH